MIESPLINIVAVVPCYRERAHILAVLAKFDDTVSHILVIDDFCPEGTGAFVKENCRDSRVEVITHERNRGVGGATLTGYARAVEIGADIIVKVDGDGQMDPRFIPTLVRPIVESRADYAKGNRLLWGDDGSTLHSDLQKGFIRAEVMKYEDFTTLGSENAVKDAGKFKENLRRW